MENLNIEGYRNVYFIPSVNFNVNTGVCEISGESYMEDTSLFYLNLTNWIEQYISEIGKPIILNIKLTYFNTSSSKALFDIFATLKTYQLTGTSVTINWYLDKDDIDMNEEVDDFKQEIEIDINKIFI